MSAVGCVPFEVGRDEVARVASPSSQVEAVLVETDGDATTSFGYQVYLVPAGKTYEQGTQVASLCGAIRSARAYGANLKWDGPRWLAVEYQEAKSAKLLQDVATVDGERVEVMLRNGVTDEDAPPGGMLFNLRKQQ